MIGQYLSNTNESATVPVLQNFLELIEEIGEGSGWLIPAQCHSILIL
jgi:hypothetical protein